MTEGYTHAEMCECLGKSVPYVRRLQTQLSLPFLKKDERYPDAYIRFMRKIISLRTFNVPVEEIKELFSREKRILEIMHFDAIADSSFWYMAEGEHPVKSATHLLLTGHDLGFPIASDSIQCNLDFRERDPELFGGHEMGEDIRRVLEIYVKALSKIDARVRHERNVLLDALSWAGGGLMAD